MHLNLLVFVLFDARCFYPNADPYPYSHCNRGGYNVSVLFLFLYLVVSLYLTTTMF